MRSSLARLALFFFACSCGSKVEDKGNASTSATSASSAAPKKTDSAAQPSRTAAPIVKLNEEYADKVCACKDAPCRTQVTIDFGDRMAKAEVPTDADDQKALSAATKRATDCINGK